MSKLLIHPKKVWMQIKYFIKYFIIHANHVIKQCRYSSNTLNFSSDDSVTTHDNPTDFTSQLELLDNID